MNPAEPSNGRIPWVDTLKGLGIALVVCGHIANDTLLQHLIYAFHMPLFFFISGFLHRPANDLRRYFRKKTIQLLVPYASFAAIASIPKAAHILRHGLTAHRMEHGFFVLLWGGAAMKGTYGVLWFLTCLFLTQQLSNWIIVRFSRSAFMVVSAASLLLSYGNSIWFPGDSLPWDANVVLAALPFFAVGYLLRDFDFGRAIPVAVGFASILATTLLLLRGIPIAYDMRSDILGVPFLTPLLALGCILFCIASCRLLTFTPVVGSMFKKLGVLSLGIMLIHKILPAVPGFGRFERHGLLLSFFVTILCSYFLAQGLLLTRITRALLLGSERDFAALKLFPLSVFEQRPPSILRTFPDSKLQSSQVSPPSLR